MDMFQVISLGLLGIIAGGVVFVAVNVRKQHLAPIFELSVDNQIERLTRATSHHIEVNSVLALTEKFKSDPNLSKNLVGYSRQVVDAALTYRVNCLGNDLKDVGRKLSSARSALAAKPNPTSFEYNYRPTVSALEALQSDIQSQLDEANALVQDRATIK